MATSALRLMNSATRRTLLFDELCGAGKSVPAYYVGGGMNQLPDNTPQRSVARRAVSQVGVGPALLSAGVALFIVTRVINWLPLGLIDGPINALIWPIILICVGLGGFLTWRKMSSE